MGKGSGMAGVSLPSASKVCKTCRARATAIAANITIVSTDGAGFLVCNPGGVTSVDASTINWSAPGQSLANGVILALDDQRRLTVVAGGGGSTHVIIDVTGYFR